MTEIRNTVLKRKTLTKIMHLLYNSTGKKMANLKFSLQPQASAHICVQCFKEVLNFRSGNEGYENVSNCQSPRGYPPWWGTDCLGTWEPWKLGR